MMQETGSNITQQNKILSIRLTPNGLCFYISVGQKVEKSGWVDRDNFFSSVLGLEQVLDDNHLLCSDLTKVQVGVCTKESLLIPSECYKVGMEASYLKVNGTQTGDANDGQIISSSLSADVIELSILPRTMVDTLNRLYPDGVEFRPLLLDLGSKSGERKPSVLIARYGNVMALVLSDKGALKFAQNLPVSNSAEVVYYVENLISEYGLSRSDFSIGVEFDSASTLVKDLKGFYKNVSTINKCE